MEPSNDHEREIAGIVDRIAAEGRLKLISIQEAVDVVDFMLTAEDSQFLMNFVQWRMANPFSK
jgi:hypothetical protein